MEKTCTKCGETKPIEMFAAKGASNRCKKCHSLQVMACRKVRLDSDDARGRKRAQEKELGIQTCKECGAEKSLSEFHSSKHHKRLGVRSICKECTNIKSMKWKADNRETARALSREWHRKYPEKSAYFYKKSHESMSAERRQANRDRTAAWWDNPENRANANARKREYQKENRGIFSAYRKAYEKARGEAMPKWLTAIHRAQIQEFYDVCIAVSVQTGVQHHVDHIVPLRGKNVRGLHVPWNLQILTGIENKRKGNRMAEVMP